MAGAGKASSPRGTGAGASAISLEGEAHSVASRLPELLIEAERIAATVTHGIHGRRRAGPGETFWQFRQYQNTDSTSLIDWRRSASSTHVYVREREWEAAHTMWLWPDLSASMDFKSHLSQMVKRDRAILLTLAASEILVRGGERVGLLGVTTPTASRRASLKLAESMAEHGDSPQLSGGLPSKVQLAKFSGLILFSDFLDPLDKIVERLTALASTGVRGHIVQILDPAEETLPYQGRTEFLGPEGSERWIADRAESLRSAYQEKLLAHRTGLNNLAHRLGWSFMVHHTDRPASEPLLSLIMHLQGVGGYQWQGAADTSGVSAIERRDDSKPEDRP